MVKITEIPITSKMKDKFEIFLKKNPLGSIVFGDFGKWENGGNCAVCGHRLIWSFRNGMTDIGICCATNLFALEKCEGNYDKLNFERIVKLEKKTIIKRQIEWKKKQIAQELEIKYNDEFKFCSEVVDLTLNDVFFQDERIVSLPDDDRNKDGRHFFFAGIPEYKTKAMSKIYQANSWLNWMKEGTVNDYYTGKLHDLMKEKPEEIIKEAKVRLEENEKIAEKEQEKRNEDRSFYDKVSELKKISLSQYDIDFVKSLYQFFNERMMYSDKQKQAIDKLFHKYRKQMGIVEEKAQQCQFCKDGDIFISTSQGIKCMSCRRIQKELDNSKQREYLEDLDESIKMNLSYCENCGEEVVLPDDCQKCGTATMRRMD